QLQKIAVGSDIVADEDALRLMAIQADGGMRDAVSLLDQCAVMSKHVNADIVRQVLGIVGREGLRNLVTVIGKGDLSAALQSMSELSAQGKDVKQIILELAEYLRALLLYKADASYEDIYLTDTAEALSALAPLYTTERILAATSRLHQTMEEIKLSAREKIVAEMCIFDLCRIQGDSLEALAARVAQLEAQLAGGQVAPQTKVSGQQAPKLSTVGAAPTTPGHSTLTAEVRPQEQNITFVSEHQQEQEFEPEQDQEFESEPAQQVQPIVNDIKVVPSENGVALWKNLCATLANKKKRTVLVYAELGKVISYDGQVLTLGLSTMMSKERLERTDYKGFIQEILSGLVGHAVALNCVLMKDNEPKQIQADKPPVRKTQPKAVKSALDVFGGTVKKY
ncbi:MAG: DNA polymerase III subunit gamma/tau, partial [Acidaminococcaceae bacterium]